mmetsp:Transcript_37000/g.104453  ORF Transcript_37000/g.104453 Transcript_37000/m.104453 type:complete len:153 (+) Transcript_37000:386-844(+)|eukprot:CAMPEP_0117654322 /NCGR_PEP_ID=MMETSP0804-20121206/3683_1 /TAXON_ID=1074897 /ORGANISM="Tetraselmis astigmatica, Strain CCMP880" /LENGTH=152 /DNA_ID=CAMNT_0005460597 /DNA_START=319 /DNA_END=777 /DNA_ORIENTATION=-
MGLCYLFDVGAAKLRQNAQRRPENNCIQVFSRMWDVILFALYMLGIFMDILIFILFLLIPFTVAFLFTGLFILGATCCTIPIEAMHLLSTGWMLATKWYINLFRPSEPVFGDWGIDCLLQLTKMKRLPGTAGEASNEAAEPLLAEATQAEAA